MRLARMPAGILRRFTAIEYGRRPSERMLPGPAGERTGDWVGNFRGVSAEIV